MRNVECTVEHLQTSSRIRAHQLVHPDRQRDLGQTGANVGDRQPECSRAAGAGIFDIDDRDSPETVWPQGNLAWDHVLPVDRLLADCRVEDRTDVTAGQARVFNGIDRRTPRQFRGRGIRVPPEESRADTENHDFAAHATTRFLNTPRPVTSRRMSALATRVVPPAVARRGSYIARGAILMPSYVNIGAYVDEGTMVDTWATVGSCAQIGKNVHLSGGVGIGGVLEPLQANPTVIEDNCFIGARSEVVEGVIIEENSVLGMGVYIGQSTPIFDRATGEITYGRVPSGSVVVSGNLPKTAANGAPYSMYAAIVVKRVDAQTRSKTSINDLLRD